MEKVKLISLMCALGAFGYAAPSAAADRSVQSPNGFQIIRPWLRAVGDQTEIHGSICRRNLGRMAPTAIRIERLDAKGEVLQAVSADVMRLGRRRLDCGPFTVAADWPVATAHSLRLCVSRGDVACRAMTD